MKGVLDTNVVVSGLLTQGGVCAGIIDQLRMGTFQLCVNGQIVAEYAKVIGRTELSIPAGEEGALRIDAGQDHGGLDPHLGVHCEQLLGGGVALGAGLPRRRRLPGGGPYTPRRKYHATCSDWQST